jgi:hypothetical protein
MLGLVMPQPRATALAGDLIEDLAARGGRWFWGAVARTMLSMLVLDVRRSTLSLTAFAVVSWFGYMFVALVLLPVGTAAAVLAWGTFTVLSNHTGLELLAPLLPLPLEWSPPPTSLYGTTELVIVAAAAPYVIGRATARWWPGRELAAGAVTVIVWPVMTVLVPFVGFRVSATLPIVPWLVGAMLAGTLWDRRHLWTPG